jgi:hypothetical protein
MWHCYPHGAASSKPKTVWHVGEVRCAPPHDSPRRWLQTVLIHRLTDLDDATLREQLGRLARLRQLTDVVPVLRVIFCIPSPPWRQFPTFALIGTTTPLIGVRFSYMGAGNSMGLISVASRMERPSRIYIAIDIAKCRLDAVCTS